MATTGTALFPGASTFPGASGVNPGQGPIPLFRARVSFDDLSVVEPVWTDKSDKLRTFSVSRGRNSELDQFDAGTATLVFDNRDRSLDPNNNASVRPLNQVWLYEEFSGETRDLFRGFTESWTQDWDQSGIVDATATAQCTDAFKILSLARLPVTDPPRDTYADVIASDTPSGYWRWQDPSIPDWLTISGFSIIAGSPIVGDSNRIGGTLRMAAGNEIDANDVGMGDGRGGAYFAIELWFRKSGNPAGVTDFFRGPANAGGAIWALSLRNTGALTFTYRDGAAATFSVSSTTILSDNTWYYVVAMVDGSGPNLRIYLNGVQDNTAAMGVQFASTLTSPNAKVLGITGVTSIDLAETAVYNLTAANISNFKASRVPAHYTAGTARGFLQKSSGARIYDVLDAVSSRAPRAIQAGVRSITGRFMHGQASLDEIEEAVSGEAVDSGFFVEGDGTARFLAADHRSSAPYDTSQATFGDGGGSELPYLAIQMDFSESFLFNEWNVSTDQGALQTVSDANSIARYFRRSQSLDNLPLPSDTDAANVATAQLAKYKDPMQRVISIKPNMADAETVRIIYARELMDRITVKRRPPGGGSAISQDLFIQRIEHSGSPGVPPTCTLGVSPL